MGTFYDRPMVSDLLLMLEFSTLALAVAAAGVALSLWLSWPKDEQPGFHWVIPIFGNELHIKRRRLPRFVEDKQHVPVLWLGRTLIAYWSRDMLISEARFSD